MGTGTKARAAVYWDMRPGHHALRLVVTGMLLAGAGVACLGGCQKALFPKDEPRTQFESTDRMRGGFAPLEVPDVFGNPQPALRQRLIQPD